MEIIKEIIKNVNTGIWAIDGIESNVRDDELKKIILSQRDNLTNFRDKALEELRGDSEASELCKGEKTMLKAAVKLKSAFDKSNSNIAEMLIEGSNMGINDLIKQSHLIEKNGGNNTPLVGELIELYDCNIKQLRQYL